MFIGEVVGNVWGVQRHPSLNRKSLFLVRPIDPMTEEHAGEPVLCLDGGFDAGPGSVVLVVDEGGSARAILGDEKAPVRTIICGIVDQIVMDGKVKHYA